MEFRITTHTGYGAPVDAIELLWATLQATRIEDAAFAKGHGEIKATWGYDEGSRATVEELMEPKRRELLEAVCEVCEGVPGLESDWYAIGHVQ
ncbi:MAG: hypothetical protein ACYDHT_03100 [Solirubrobacteraceae bacterium]